MTEKDIDTTKYHNNYPPKKGWYMCLIGDDDEETKLYHFYCELSCKHKWTDENGEQIVDEVRWREN